MEKARTVQPAPIRVPGPRRRWWLAAALALAGLAAGLGWWEASGDVAGPRVSVADTPRPPEPKADPPAPPVDLSEPAQPVDPFEASEPGAYVFPVQPARAASYGREHHTYPATDVFAACGTQLVAVTDGRIDEASDTDRWDPAVDDPATRSGRFVALVGDDGVRYHLSHLERLAPGVAAGARLQAGEPIGRVGRSGNARSTPCHVHLGISPPLGPGDWEVRRGVVWPWPYLDAWREGRALSPRAAVGEWRRDHLSAR